MTLVAYVYVFSTYVYIGFDESLFDIEMYFNWCTSAKEKCLKNVFRTQVKRIIKTQTDFLNYGTEK